MRTDTGHRIYIHNTNCSLVKSNGTNQHTLRLRVTHDCNRIDLRTRIRIDPKLWDNRESPRTVKQLKYPLDMVGDTIIIQKGGKIVL